MRAVFVGASALTVETARLSLSQGIDVVIIEEDKEKLEKLADQLDCGLVQGDGSRPSVLEEIDPRSTDCLFCLTNSDQDNIIASLVGKQLGFGRVITKVEDQDFESVCQRLALQDTIVPQREAARRLTDVAAGRVGFMLSALLRGDLRLYALALPDTPPDRLRDLDVPNDTHVIAIARGDVMHLPSPDMELQAGDQVVVLTRNTSLGKLGQR